MNINGAGCSSTVFPVEGVQYSRVCGKIIGFQMLFMVVKQQLILIMLMVLV